MTPPILNWRYAKGCRLPPSMMRSNAQARSPAPNSLRSRSSGRRPHSGTRLKIGLLAAFLDAPRDEGIDLFGNRWIERRRRVFGECALPQFVGLLPGLR